MFFSFCAFFKGYKLVKVYEVYHFEETTEYDNTSGADGLFSEYVNTFLKIKQEASGWPRNEMSELEKHQYIEDYEQNEGIRLESSRIEKNPGLRSLAKLCLNS